MDETKTLEAEGGEQYYKLTDIMRILHISRSTAYKLVKEEGFPKLLLYGSYRIPKAAFEKWCKEQETQKKI